MRAKLLVLTLLLLVVMPSAALADDAPTLSQRFQQFATVVKQTVVDIWHKWTGQPPQAPSQPMETAAKPAQPVQPAQPPAQQPGQPAQPSQAPQANLPAPSAVLPPAVATPTAAETIKKTHEDLKSKGVFEVKTEGQAHAANLKNSKSGVPLYDFLKHKNIESVPALDVGREPEISRRNFALPDWNWKIKELQQVQQLPSPAMMPAKEFASAPSQLTKATPVKLSAADKSIIEGRVTHEKIEKIEYKIKDVSDVQMMAYEPFTEDQIKMLVVKILFDRGDRCPVVLGLADEMAAKEKYRTEALFELGSCAKDLKLHQVTFEKLSELIRKGDAEFGPRALAVLGTGLPPVFEQPFYEATKGLEGKEFPVDKKAKSEIYYRMAKGAFRAGKYKMAEELASHVDGSTFGPSAQYVIAISQFESKERQGARDTMEKLASSADGDDVLKGLVAGNLGRMDFTAHKYDLALAQYLKVPKDHPLWVQALIEQGWTQLALEDFAGAIGNMYSLHSPYFKALYQPQSFVVRTVGYLNICQYGDAYRTLTKLENDYRDWDAKLMTYMSPQRTPGAVYETVKNYLRSKSTTEVDGLPFQVVREAARGKAFLSLQEAMNDKADELGLYGGIADKLRKEKENVRIRAEQAKKKAEQLSAKLANAEKTKLPAAQVEDLKRNIEREKQRAVPNRYMLGVLEQSQQNFGRFQKNEQARTVEAQHKLAGEASSVLYERLKAMHAEIQRTLDNNEFLRYEIFAGSGENIRYQVAGGQTGGDTSRLPASVKPQKMMNWAFDGEFWEDEIGNYRSSLHNNCPKSGNRNADQAKSGG